MRIEQEIELFESITTKMVETFKKKRHDYGQTSTETVKKYGMVAMLIRMYDKLGRLDNLLVQKLQRKVADEKAEDTLLDLANYAIISLIELEKLKAEEIKSEV